MPHVADDGPVVLVARGVEEFAAACRSVLTDAVTERDREMRSIEPRDEGDLVTRSVHDVRALSPAGRSPGATGRGATA